MPRDFANEQEVQFASPQVTRSLPIGHQRLLVLAEFLETRVLPADFDMSDWQCGSSACALGWARMIPDFRKAGYDCGEDGPSFGEHRSFRAAEAFFGLPRFDGSELFGIQHVNEGPRAVAARIRTFVAEQAREAVACGEAR